jgi:signal transduction histidine kinase
MIQYTIENNTVLYLFETLLSGVVLLILVWDHFYEPRLAKPSQAGLIAAFFFLSGFSLFKCIYSFVLSSGTSSAGLEILALLAPGLETLFVLCLVISVGKWGRLQYPLWVVSLLLLGAIPFLVSSEGPFQRLENPYSIALLNCLLMGILFVRIVGHQGLRGGMLQLGMLFFLLSYMCDLLYQSQFALPFWNAQHLTKLLGLFCFVLHFEKEQERIFVQFFIRLNLVFIFSASVFMLVLSDQERKHYLEFSGTNTQDFGEFLRGHVVYYHRQGETPQTILESPQINDKVVSEFGRIPNLREVRVELTGSQLRMAIDEDGIISYETGQGLFATDPRFVYDYERNTVTVLRVPIIFEGKQIGGVVLAENLLSLTQSISRQMSFIFLSFTVIVLVTFVSLGLIMMRAHRIIQEQYQNLEERNRELVHASQLAAVGQLVDNVAHEVNNPAGVVLIRSECALAAPDCPESIQEDLQEIRIQATRMTKIVRNLLGFSRPKSTQTINVDLNKVIVRSMAFLNSYHQMDGVEAHLDLNQSLPFVSGDPDRLEQVVINVGKNAVEAIPDGGILTVRTDLEEEFVKLKVEDTGVGMPEETLKKIFDPFFSTKEVGRGTGLGLAISNQIIKDHGGRIEAESEPGEGTTISIFLPPVRR